MTRRNIAATGARVSILDSWSMRDSWNQWELWKGGVLTVGSPADWAKRSLLTGTSCDTMSVGTDGGEERIWLHLHCNEKHFLWLHPHRKHFCEAAGFWFIMRISGKKVVLFRIRFKKKNPRVPTNPQTWIWGSFLLSGLSLLYCCRSFGILVTAVTPGRQEMVARPTTVPCRALSVTGDIC